MLAHCFVLLHLYLNDLFRERERGRYREQNRSGRRRRWLCAVLFDAEEKNEIEGRQRVTKKRKRRKCLRAL